MTSQSQLQGPTHQRDARLCAGLPVEKAKEERFREFHVNKSNKCSCNERVSERVWSGISISNRFNLLLSLSLIKAGE